MSTLNVLQVTTHSGDFRKPGANPRRLEVLRKALEIARDNSCEIVQLPAGFLAVGAASSVKGLIDRELVPLARRYYTAIVGGVDADKERRKNPKPPYYGFILSKRGTLRVFGKQQSSRNAGATDGVPATEQNVVDVSSRVARVGGRRVELLVCGEMHSRWSRESLHARGLHAVLVCGHESLGEGLARNPPWIRLREFLRRNDKPSKLLAEYEAAQLGGVVSLDLFLAFVEDKTELTRDRRKALRLARKLLLAKEMSPSVQCWHRTLMLAREHASRRDSLLLEDIFDLLLAFDRRLKVCEEGALLDDFLSPRFSQEVNRKAALAIIKVGGWRALERVAMLPLEVRTGETIRRALVDLFCQKLNVRDFHPATFERFVAQLLRMEYKDSCVAMSPKDPDGGQDGGVDIVVYKPGKLDARFVVQCKRWRRPVRMKYVHKALHDALRCDADAIFVTTSQVRGLDLKSKSLPIEDYKATNEDGHEVYRFTAEGVRKVLEGKQLVLPPGRTHVDLRLIDRDGLTSMIKTHGTEASFCIS